MGVVRLPHDSGSKLTVGQLIAWRSSSRGKLCIFSYHRCHIYRTKKSREVGGERGILKISMGGKPQRDGTIFMGEFDPSRHHVKILNFVARLIQRFRIPW